MSFSSRVICDPPPPATRMIRVISAAVWALPVAISIAALVATPSKTGTALAELFKSKDFVQDIRISVASLLDTEATLQDPESFRKTAAAKRYRTIFDMRLRNEKTFPMKLAYLPQPTVRAARPHIQTAEKSTLKAAPVMTLAAKPGISRETVATIAPQSQTFASAPLVQTRTFQNARVASANALSVGGMTIVLTGINPPRTSSKCRRLDGALLDCIDRAEARMAILLIGRTVTCRISQPVREGYVAGQCKAGKIDIAHDLLRHGLANRTTAANSNTLL